MNKSPSLKNNSKEIKKYVEYISGNSKSFELMYFVRFPNDRKKTYYAKGTPEHIAQIIDRRYPAHCTAFMGYRPRLNSTFKKEKGYYLTPQNHNITDYPIFQIDVETKAHDKTLTIEEATELLQWVYDRLPVYVWAAVVATAYTGGGASIFLKLDDPKLAAQQIELVIAGLKKLLSPAAEYIDQTCFSFKKSQRIIGTVNLKRGVCSQFVEDSAFATVQPSVMHTVKGLDVKALLKEGYEFAGAVTANKRQYKKQCTIS